jgi:hypothetical protein
VKSLARLIHTGRANPTRLEPEPCPLERMFDSMPSLMLSGSLRLADCHLPPGRRALLGSLDGVVYVSLLLHAVTIAPRTEWNRYGPLLWPGCDHLLE